MQLSILNKSDLEGVEKRLSNLEQRFQQMAPLYAGDIFTDDDLQKMLRVSKRTLFTWRKEGVITYSQVGKMIFYIREDVERLLATHKHEATV